MRLNVFYDQHFHCAVINIIPLTDLEDGETFAIPNRRSFSSYFFYIFIDVTYNKLSAYFMVSMIWKSIILILIINNLMNNRVNISI